MTQAIPPAQIESELERIWDSLQGTNKMRACLFNLIVYSKKDKRAEYLNEIAKKVIQKFPSRIIFVTSDEKASESDLKTSVDVLTAEEGENAIVCDFINIDAAGKSHAIVPFVILPHILPDLPVYLVYADDPTQADPVSTQIEKFATRTIFDSEVSENLPAFAKSILEHKETLKSDIADLNWGRIEGWRELLAGTFRTPEKFECLQKAATLHIRYNSEETEFLCHTPVQSIYMQGWLACRLGWTLKNTKHEGDTLSFSYEKEGTPITVYLHPQKMSSLRPGRIISLEILTTSEERFLFQRGLDNPNHITIEISNPEKCSLPTHFIFNKDESGQSLVKEICHKGTSKHYTALLTMLSQVKNEDLCK